MKFYVVERGNPSNSAAPKKFYPSIESSGRKTLRQMAERISQISTVSTADTMAVLEALLTTIPDELAAGNIVEMDDMSFYTRIIPDERQWQTHTDCHTANYPIAIRFKHGGSH